MYHCLIKRSQALQQFRMSVIVLVLVPYLTKQDGFSYGMVCLQYQHACLQNSS